MVIFIFIFTFNNIFTKHLKNAVCIYQSVDYTG